ncbi:HIT domain-containing protein [Dactylosporangium sp. NPDC005555]|uniref:HIT family protein n=1 Tax=Dactylosporangium sp. NPDC005555 TaxID=3154889 RepID=UPI0033A2DEF6
MSFTCSGRPGAACAARARPTAAPSAPILTRYCRANVLVCDGEVAFQTVLHFHLHVIPRYAEDGWALKAGSPERERSLLDSDAQAIKDAITSTD